MKLKESNLKLDLNIPKFNFDEVFNKTIEEVKKSYFDGPELFVERFIYNSKDLQQLGDTNGWETSELVYKEVDKRIRDKRIVVVSKKELALLTIEVLSQKYEAPKKAESKKNDTKKEKVTKIENLSYVIKDSLIDKEVQVDSKTTLSINDFEAHINSKYTEKHRFVYEDDKVNVIFDINEDEADEADEEEVDEDEADEE